MNDLLVLDFLWKLNQQQRIPNVCHVKTKSFEQISELSVCFIFEKLFFLYVEVCQYPFYKLDYGYQHA